MANEKWSAFPTESSPVSGDTLVGLHSGANVQFTSLGSVLLSGSGDQTITGGYSLIVGDTGNIQALEGNIIAGSSGFRGHIFVYPPTAGMGVLEIAAADSSAMYTGLIINASLSAARTWTLPNESGTFALTSGGVHSDITSLTGITGNIGAPTNILDTYGHPVLSFATTSPILGNSITIENSSPGNPPTILVSGTDTNINLAIEMLGTGTFQIYSQGNTPITFLSGASFETTSIFNFPDSSHTNTYTFPDASGTIALTSNANWINVTTSTYQMVAGNKYISDFSGQTVFTLPTSAAVGTILAVKGGLLNTGFRINQNAGQHIKIGPNSSTTGVTGYATSSASTDTLFLVCLLGNTIWGETGITGAGINLN